MTVLALKDRSNRARCLDLGSKAPASKDSVFAGNLVLASRTPKHLLARGCRSTRSVRAP